MELTLKAMIGQRLVAGFPGYEITDALRSVVKEYKVGNIILFAENVRDCAQLRRLCAQLQELIRGETGLPAFITIDQEGGVVSRLGEDAAVVPGAMCVSATGNPHNAWTAGYITGRELAALGVNFDLAPVMDVNSNPQNPVIGVRSYGDTPETVARFGVEMIRGLREGGVLSCAKHFPGHGDTAVDSHLSLPRVDKSLAELEACELIPFRAAIEAGVPAVMTTHILFPQLEPDGVPATMSRRIITGLLKERLGFQGLVVSDCMMMQAIEKYFGTVNGVVAAARARGFPLRAAPQADRARARDEHRAALSHRAAQRDFMIARQHQAPFVAARPDKPAHKRRRLGVAHARRAHAQRRAAAAVAHPRKRVPDRALYGGSVRAV